MLQHPKIQNALNSHPYPFVLCVLGGARAYGVDPNETIVDIRGMHIIPAVEMFKLDPIRETIELSDESTKERLTMCTHDTKKYAALLLEGDPYALEDLLTGQVIAWTPFADDLKTLARGCITRTAGERYLAEARRLWNARAAADGQPSARATLLAFRVVLAGTWLMKSGQVEPNIYRLNTEVGSAMVESLLMAKLANQKADTIDAGLQAGLDGEFERLCGELQEARSASKLAETPTNHQAMNEWLVKTRALTLERVLPKLLGVKPVGAQAGH